MFWIGATSISIEEHMEIITTPELVTYPDALAAMDARVRAIQAGTAEELIWYVEHPPLYTAGTSAKGTDLLSARGFPVYETGRGGQYTYHGPGQRVVYLMLDLKQRGRDVRAYVQQLEGWIIAALAEFGVDAFTRDGRIGVWVQEEFGVRSSEFGERSALRRAPLAAGVSVAKGGHPPPQEKKIAALGVRVQQWVTSHGIALNVAPDLTHYAGIVPCGIREFGVTSLAALGLDVSLQQADAALQKNCPFI